MTTAERQAKAAKACEWLGIWDTKPKPAPTTSRFPNPKPQSIPCPPYDDALAMRVLRELAKRGYEPCGGWATDQWIMELWDRDGRRFKGTADNPADAILLAADALREKEGVKG